MSNTTTITGNLTREPEIRYTREGQAIAQLGLAVNRRWQDRTTQEWQEATSFFDVMCWRDLAENVALSLSKGMRVVVTGRIEQRSWETDDGEHRSKVEIVADEIGPSLRFATADVQRPSAAGGCGMNIRVWWRVRELRAEAGVATLRVQQPRLCRGCPRSGPRCHAGRARGARAGCLLESRERRTVPPNALKTSPSISHPITSAASPDALLGSHSTHSALNPRPSATSVCFTRVAFEAKWVPPQIL